MIYSKHSINISCYYNHHYHPPLHRLFLTIESWLIPVRKISTHVCACTHIHTCKHTCTHAIHLTVLAYLSCGLKLHLYVNFNVFLSREHIRTPCFGWGGFDTKFSLHTGLSTWCRITQWLVLTPITHSSCSHLIP